MQAQTAIRRRTGLSGLQLTELWQHRELIWYLAWRDILVRYKQTAIGILWAIIRPLIAMVALSVVFGRIGKLPSDGVPYPLLTFTGLLAWQFFASAFAESSSSVVGNASLVSKVYFPRLAVPISSVIASLVDFAIMLVFLVVLLFWYRVRIQSTIVFLPLFALLVLVVALGAGIWFSALFVKYRDIRHLVPFLVQFGVYVSPVGFSSSVVPARWRGLYAINPMVAAIDGFRWSLFGAPAPPPAELWTAAAISVATLVVGAYYFRQTERTFADLI